MSFYIVVGREARNVVLCFIAEYIQSSAFMLVHGAAIEPVSLSWTVFICLRLLYCCEKISRISEDVQPDPHIDLDKMRLSLLFLSIFMTLAFVQARGIGKAIVAGFWS